tara:strand:+ start:83 stop:214 length:132 start_codon:yes stop_codon:yes gene_type:complete
MERIKIFIPKINQNFLGAKVKKCSIFALRSRFIVEFSILEKPC